ncbi:MAG: hypothetical protein ACRENP_04070 [Longimicrobiales bacterium]
MAHLWLEESAEQWAVIPLESQRVSLARVHAVASRVRGPRPQQRSSDAYLVRTSARDRDVWHLLAAPEAAISVNGLPVLGGLRVLEDRDEIHVAGEDALFYSTEELARIVTMPETEQPMTCPRCRQRVEPGTPAVCCPCCKIWYHQTEALPCWLYAPFCAFCPQPTPFDTGFRWTPLEL